MNKIDKQAQKIADQAERQQVEKNELSILAQHISIPQTPI